MNVSEDVAEEVQEHDDGALAGGHRVRHQRGGGRQDDPPPQPGPPPDRGHLRVVAPAHDLGIQEDDRARRPRRSGPARAAPRRPRGGRSSPRPTRPGTARSWSPDRAASETTARSTTRLAASTAVRAAESGPGGGWSGGVLTYSCDGTASAAVRLGGPDGLLGPPRLARPPAPPRRAGRGDGRGRPEPRDRRDHRPRDQGRRPGDALPERPRLVDAASHQPVRDRAADVHGARGRAARRPGRARLGRARDDAAGGVRRQDPRAREAEVDRRLAAQGGRVGALPGGGARPARRSTRSRS